MYAYRLARLLETQKCGSLACVLLSFLVALPLLAFKQSARRAFDVQQRITRREQVTLRFTFSSS